MKHHISNWILSQNKKTVWLDDTVHQTYLQMSVAVGPQGMFGRLYNLTMQGFFIP